MAQTIRAVRESLKQRKDDQSKLKGLEKFFSKGATVVACGSPSPKPFMSLGRRMMSAGLLGAIAFAGLARTNAPMLVESLNLVGVNPAEIVASAHKPEVRPSEFTLKSGARVAEVNVASKGKSNAVFGSLYEVKDDPKTIVGKGISPRDAKTFTVVSASGSAPEIKIDAPVSVDESISAEAPQSVASATESFVAPLPPPRPDTSVVAADQGGHGASSLARERSAVRKLFGLNPRPGPALGYAEPGDNSVLERPAGIPGGYDRFTAVYDISAHVVYMPDGSRLEAHSGRGEDFDNPDRVNERAKGSTPPNLYNLSPVGLFHGVRALGLSPSNPGAMFGRGGILAHSYLYGPRGESHGCVAFKDYPAFLQAYERGEVKRIAVVRRLEPGMRLGDAGLGDAGFRASLDTGKINVLPEQNVGKALPDYGAVVGAAPKLGAVIQNLEPKAQAAEVKAGLPTDRFIKVAKALAGESLFSFKDGAHWVDTVLANASECMKMPGMKWECKTSFNGVEMDFSDGRYIAKKDGKVVAMEQAGQYKENSGMVRNLLAEAASGVRVDLAVARNGDATPDNDHDEALRLRR